MKIEKISNEQDTKQNSISTKNNENIICPFCMLDGFDLIGLKSHLEHGYCDKYNKIDISVIHRFFV